MESDAWNRRYRASDHLWSGEPHDLLVEMISGLEPGRALDIACGEGADAIWLAGQGWSVVAVDFSEVAIERARAAAAAREVDVQFVVGDLAEWIPEGEFDLIAEFYLHHPRDARRKLHRRLQRSVRPGGRYLVVGHHSEHEREGGGPPPELRFDPEDLAEDFTDLEVERAERLIRDTAGPNNMDTVFLGYRSPVA